MGTLLKDFEPLSSPASSSHTQPHLTPTPGAESKGPRGGHGQCRGEEAPGFSDMASPWRRPAASLPQALATGAWCPTPRRRPQAPGLTSDIAPSPPPGSIPPGSDPGPRDQGDPSRLLQSGVSLADVKYSASRESEFGVSFEGAPFQATPQKIPHFSCCSLKTVLGTII